jgi:molybdate/tungstate transport system substrate-binding protein
MGTKRHGLCRQFGLLLIFLGNLLTLNGAFAETNVLTVFHAGSLSVPLKKMAEAFMAENPGVTVNLEAAGSRACARKITDLKKPCDVMASADYAVIDSLLIPQFADWNLKFAVNEMGIAFRPESRRSTEIGTATWADILLDPAIAYGRSDPDSDPCGYRTVLLFRLAEKVLHRPGLADQLLAKDNRFIRPKETDLLALLETGSIDFFIIYRSVAVQHHLSFLRLPPDLNLADPAKADWYGAVSVELTGSEPGRKVTQKGEPIVYGVTIPKNAPHPELAAKFVALLIDPGKGAKTMAEQGQDPLLPALVKDPTVLPEPLKALVRQEP